MLKLEDARKELSGKTYRQIQEETAWKWASRAAASYEIVVSAPDLIDKLGFLLVAEEYYHESIEHAALVEDGDGSLVKKISEELAPYRKMNSLGF